MNVSLVPVVNVDAIWQHVGGMVVGCLEKAPSYFTAGDVWQWCRSGQAFLFVIHDGEKPSGVAVWQFGSSDGRPAFICLVMAGEEMDAWAHTLFKEAAMIAKNGGVTLLSATGRVGLAKKLKQTISGVKVTRQTYLMEV